MKMWKVVGVFLLLLIISTLPTYASGLTQQQLSSAKQVATQLSTDKNIFAYESKSGCRPHRHFILSDIKTTSDAYLINPYCHQINIDTDQMRGISTDNDGSTYQLRMMFAMCNYEKEQFKKVVYVIKQGEKVITPVSVKYTPLQSDIQSGLFGSISWYKIGVVMEINASDITPGEKLDIIATGNGQESIKFKLHTDKPNEYDTKSHSFMWNPLNDDL